MGFTITPEVGKPLNISGVGKRVVDTWEQYKTNQPNKQKQKTKKQTQKKKKKQTKNQQKQTKNQKTKNNKQQNKTTKTKQQKQKQKQREKKRHFEKSFLLGDLKTDEVCWEYHFLLTYGGVLCQNYTKISNSGTF